MQILLFLHSFSLSSQERRSHGGLDGVPGGGVLQGQDRLYHRGHWIHGQGGFVVLFESLTNFWTKGVGGETTQKHLGGSYLLANSAKGASSFLFTFPSVSMLWCPILQNSFLERGSDPAAAGCPAWHQDLRPGQEGEGGGDCISHDIGTGARSIDVVLTGARTNVLLAPVLVVSSTLLLTLVLLAMWF